MDTPVWVEILAMLGPTLWLLTFIVLVGTTFAMMMAGDRGRRSGQSWDWTAWTLDLMTSEDRPARDLGANLLRLRARAVEDPRERRMLGELASAARFETRPVDGRHADARTVPITPSDIAAARLMVITSGRLGEPVPQWVQRLAAGTVEVDEGADQDH